MDMSTIQSRISQHQYNTAQEIYNDFKLMLNNCFTYNPPGTPVHEVGRQLERVWQEKWNNTAVLHSKGDAEEEDDEFAGVDVEAEIRSLEKQVSDMTYRLTRLRAYRSKHNEKARAKASAAASHAKTSKTAPTNHASASKPSKAKTTSASKTAPSSKPRKQSTSNGNAGHKKPTYEYDDDEEVFEDVAPVNVSLAQKQELADKIGEVDHTTLQSALEIISATTSVQDVSTSRVARRTGTDLFWWNRGMTRLNLTLMPCRPIQSTNCTTSSSWATPRANRQRRRRQQEPPVRNVKAVPRRVRASELVAAVEHVEGASRMEMKRTGSGHWRLSWRLWSNMAVEIMMVSRLLTILWGNPVIDH